MNDLKVQQYIDASFAWQNSVFRGADRLSKAWNWLYMKRQNEDPKDDNAEMAAAV